MEIRITDDGSEKDINEINWLCIKYLFVSEELRGQGIGKRL